jgi:hypothetical protein
MQTGEIFLATSRQLVRWLPELGLTIGVAKARSHTCGYRQELGSTDPLSDTQRKTV